MDNPLRISAIALSGRRRGLPEPVYGRRDIWFDVSITIGNDGREALHVIAEIRSLAYDAATRTLTLRLAEARPGPLQKNAPSYTLPTPRTITIEPGASTQLKLPLPAILRELRGGDGMALALHETDLRAMRKIHVEITASEHPIGSTLALPAPEMRRHLARWGSTVSAEAAVTPDTRD